MHQQGANFNHVYNCDKLCANFSNVFEVLPNTNTEHIKDCQGSAIKSCQWLKVDFLALSQSPTIRFPNGDVLEREAYLDEQTMRFKGSGNLECSLFVEANRTISGTLHGSSGRVFDIATCLGEDCFVWIEIDATTFQDPPRGDGIQSIRLDPTWGGNELADRNDLIHPEKVGALIAQGLSDPTTIATVSIKFYYTPEMSSTTSNMEAFVRDVVSETNAGYINSRIPLRVEVHCVEKYFHNENTNIEALIREFRDYKGSTRALLGGSDVAILLVENSDRCGLAFSNTVKEPLAVVRKVCAKGFFSVGHEIAHIFGAQHNREATSQGYYPFGYAYLVGGNTDSRTILAYRAEGHGTRINYYSNNDTRVRFEGQKVGDRVSDNARVLRERRFIIQAIGDQTESCPLEPPRIDGKWASWSAWTLCALGQGTRTRSRQCQHPRPANGGKDCPASDPKNESKPCKCENLGPDKACDGSSLAGQCHKLQQGIPGYCRASCELCNPKDCVDIRDDCPRLGELDFCYQYEVYMATYCPFTCGACFIHAEHSNPADHNRSSELWQNASECNSETGKILQTRVCQTNECVGESTQTLDCPVDGGWSDWTDGAESCDQDSGNKMQERVCSQPATKNGGLPCQGDQTQVVPCPVDGNWGAWGAWNTCQQDGTKTRERECNQPSAKNGGQTCPGSMQDSTGCGSGLDSWGPWSAWSECRNGRRIQRRQCSNPPCDSGTSNTKWGQCHMEDDANCVDLVSSQECQKIRSEGNCANQNYNALCWKTCQSCSVCRDNWELSNCLAYKPFCHQESIKHFLAFLCRETCDHCTNDRRVSYP